MKKYFCALFALTLCLAGCHPPAAPPSALEFSTESLPDVEYMPQLDSQAGEDPMHALYSSMQSGQLYPAESAFNGELAEGVTLQRFSFVPEKVSGAPVYYTSNNHTIWLDETRLLYLDCRDEAGAVVTWAHLLDLGAGTVQSTRILMGDEIGVRRIRPSDRGILVRFVSGAWLLNDTLTVLQHQPNASTLSDSCWAVSDDLTMQAWLNEDYALRVQNLETGEITTWLEGQYDPGGDFLVPMAFTEDHQGLMLQYWGGGMWEPSMSDGALLSLDTGTLTAMHGFALQLLGPVAGLPDTLLAADVVMGGPTDYSTLALYDIARGERTILPVGTGKPSADGVEYALYPFLDNTQPVLICPGLAIGQDNGLYWDTLFLYDLERDERIDLFQRRGDNALGEIHTFNAVSPARDRIALVEQDEETGLYTISIASW